MSTGSTSVTALLTARSTSPSAASAARDARLARLPPTSPASRSRTARGGSAPSSARASVPPSRTRDSAAASSAFSWRFVTTARASDIAASSPTPDRSATDKVPVYAAPPRVRSSGPMIGSRSSAASHRRRIDASVIARRHPTATRTAAISSAHQPRITTLLTAINVRVLKGNVPPLS